MGFGPAGAGSPASSARVGKRSTAAVGWRVTEPGARVITLGTMQSAKKHPIVIEITQKPKNSSRFSHGAKTDPISNLPFNF